MVGGLLRILACTALVFVVVGGVLYAREIGVRSVRVGRRLHLVRPPAPSPVGLPFERVAHDLRRLRQEVHRPRRGMADAKRRGVTAAYDDLLLDACRALEVPTSLGSLPEGIERESERLRLELELERAGIPIRTAS